MSHLKYILAIVNICLLVGCAVSPKAFHYAFQKENKNYRLYETTPEILYEEPYMQSMSLLGVLDYLESGYMEGGGDELSRRIENKRQFVRQILELLKADKVEQRELMGEAGRLFRYQVVEGGAYESGLIILGKDGSELHRWPMDAGPVLTEE